MKKEKTSIRNKEIITLVLIILIFILIRFALLYIGARLGETRENELIQLKMSVLTDIVSDAGEKRAAAARRVSDRLSADTRLMTTMLREFCTEDGYAGPRVFPDGFVAELRGDRVILPPEAQVYEPQISRRMIEEDLRARAGGSEQMTVVLEKQNGTDSPDSYYLCFGEIAGNYVYADVMSVNEYTEYLDRYSGLIDEVLETADESFGGITLLINEVDGRLEIVRRFGNVEDLEELPDMDLVEAVLQPSSVVTLDGKNYHCSASRLEKVGEENAYVLQLIPQVSLREQNVSRALIIVLLMLIMFTAVTVYVISVQHRTADGRMTREEAEHYRPDKVRRRMISVGVLCVLIVFLVAVLVESVGQLYMELRYGRDTMRLFAGQVEKESQDRLDSVSREEESWYVYYGEEMAALISAYPELSAPDKLQEYCDVLDIDYIMLFDSEGSEIACSRDYVGFTLGDSQEDGEDPLLDFRRLLHGVPSIIRQPSVDSTTGLERQLIGVKVPASEPGKLHSALIMALPPDRTDAGMLALAGDRTLSLETTRGTSCFVADSASGEILYASDASMLGKTVGECGLPENSLQDGYMDFTAIGGTSVLVITVREGEYVYYYAAEAGTLFERVFQYGVLAALLFALVLILLLAFLLRGDNEKVQEEWSELIAHDRPQTRQLNTDERDAVTIVSVDDTGDVRETGDGQSAAEQETGKKKSLLKKILDLLQWHQRKPGQRSSFVIRVGIIILIMCCLDVLNGKSFSGENYETMLGFLLHGDWMRGLNLFSLCSCLMIISIAYLINLVSSLVLKLTGILFAGHGETICRLLYSCVKYVTVLGVIYFCLEYLGFPTSTILAALASVSLAFSLGAQDLIADILAGLAIVFDGSFRVGDVVEINGRKGTVLELGVRATRMRIPVNNIMIINNHEIKDILNLSKECSECQVNFRVSTKYSLEELKEILNRELPKLSGKDSRILYGPYLIGVTALPVGNFVYPGITLTVGAMHEERDEEEVTWFLNEELKLIAEREGIEMI